MTPLSDRYLDYLDSRPPDTASAARHAVLAFVGVALLLAAATGLALSHDLLLAGPFVPMAGLLGHHGVGRARLVWRSRQGWKRARRIAVGGSPVTCCVVRAHEDLYRCGTVPLPCQVLFCFDPDVNAEPEYLRHLARRWSARLPGRERFLVGRRQRLPDELTDGYAVYCADLMVAPAYLVRGHLSTGLLTCVAEPGATGGIELVPYWLLFPFYASPQAGPEQRV